MDARPRGKVAIEFLTNPYVVLVDLLIATFFIMVLYLQAVRIANQAATDPRTAKIQEFQSAIKGEVVRLWGDGTQDESESSRVQPPPYLARLTPEEAWWRTRPTTTEVVVKQDASFFKLVLFGTTEEAALFRRGSAELVDPKRLVRKVVDCLGRSSAARGLVNNDAILNIAVEGHTGEEGFRSEDESWQVSVERALAVRRALQRLGQHFDTDYKRLHPGAPSLFSPGRFSVVGRAHYLNLPGSTEQDVRNRRVQIEIRFTQRYRPGSTPTGSAPVL